MAAGAEGFGAGGASSSLSDSLSDCCKAGCFATGLGEMAVADLREGVADRDFEFAAGGASCRAGLLAGGGLPESDSFPDEDSAADRDRLRTEAFFVREVDD